MNKETETGYNKKNVKGSTYISKKVNKPAFFMQNLFSLSSVDIIGILPDQQLSVHYLPELQLQELTHRIPRTCSLFNQD